MTLTGYAGVLLANTAAASLTGWRRGLFLPVALAGRRRSWPCCASSSWRRRALVGALPAARAHRAPDGAGRRPPPDDRPVALPVAIGCLAGAALLALPDGLLGPVAAALVLTVLYGVAMTVGGRAGRDLRAGRRRARPRCVPLASVVLLRAEGERTTLAAVLLAVQGAFTLGWAWRTSHDPVPAEDGAADRTSATAWRGGRGPARAGVLGGRGGRWPGRRRVVHPAGGGRAADRRRTAAGARRLVARVGAGPAGRGRAVGRARRGHLRRRAGGGRAGRRGAGDGGGRPHRSAGTAHDRRRDGAAVGVGFTVRALPWPLGDGARRRQRAARGRDAAGAPSGRRLRRRLADLR